MQLLIWHNNSHIKHVYSIFPLKNFNAPGAIGLISAALSGPVPEGPPQEEFVSFIQT